VGAVGELRAGDRAQRSVAQRSEQEARSKKQER
jgi:hypothetical protein